MFDPLNVKAVSEKINDLLFPEVIPSWSIPITETYKTILAVRLQNPGDAFDEDNSVLDFYMMKTAEIEDEIELLASLNTTLVETNSELETRYHELNATFNDLLSSHQELTQRYERLERDQNILATNYKTLQSSYSSLQSTHNTLKSEHNSLENQHSTLQSQYNTLEYQYSVAQSSQSTLQQRLNKILSITVIQHYEWVYGRFFLWKDRYQWDLQIPLSLFCEYYERSRPMSWSNWPSMAKDPNDDYYIDRMIQQINAAAISEGFTEIEKVNFVIAFVQSLPYTVDNVTTPWNEYPRYPIETLFDRGGDCEDTSILVAALLDRLGYDVALLILAHENHVAVGVSIQGATGRYYPYDSKQYFYLETTGDGWKIGQMPDFDQTSAYIYPLNP